MKKIILILIILSAACKEAYDPPVISTNHAYLVVEGFINNGTDSTLITLSRTFKLNDSVKTAPPELHAQVSVQGDDNSVYPLTEIGHGMYGVASLALNSARYRLRVVTSNGRQYQSDYVPLKSSPPLDSVNWTSSANGLRIYANTHDPQNASQYYRWSYTETWEFHAIYYSNLQYVHDSLQYRAPNNIYFCWTSDTSTNILLASSAKLARDVIYEAPLVQIPPDSWKIGYEYSILVKQYVLTPDAYNFWVNLQTNTEQIGSLFSPQPSAPKGNLHCITDSTEQVIGYISAGTLAQQRIFIKPEQIPNWNAQTYSDMCDIRSTPNQPDSLAFYLGAVGDIPIDFSPPPAPPSSRVDYSTYGCVDCRVLGTNAKPSFWP